jgi:predicted DNA-binding protein (MmcQ/YjbR family)
LTENDLKSYCLALPGAYEDRPFHDDTVVYRHRGNGRIFVFLINAHGRLHINLKCEPMRADLLRSAYNGVEPGYHMNKRHWNSVFLGSDVPDSQLKNLVDISHTLTRPVVRPGLSENGAGGGR